MKLKKKYVDINDTLKAIKTQVIDGLPYASKTLPIIKTPEQLWNYLKPKLIYESDPPNIELLQTYQTLMVNNFHNIPGAGDCDCFSIATLTCGIICDFKNMDVLLVGRDRLCPVHIYTQIKFAGKTYILDFTQPKFNSERFYPYKQKIPVKWTNWR